jgi:REP element-mobilizing transposase RayT
MSESAKAYRKFDDRESVLLTMKTKPDILERGHRQLRKGRHSIPGAYYSVTLATIGRKPLLANAKIANVILETLEWLETNGRCRWFCLIVMPDHIHTVIQLGENQTLSRLIKSFKNFTAKQINTYLGRSGSLWQAAYHEHGVRQEESLNAIIRYCYENPVRSGLSKAAKDYPYWWCKFKME